MTERGHPTYIRKPLCFRPDKSWAWPGVMENQGPSRDDFVRMRELTKSFWKCICIPSSQNWFTLKGRRNRFREVKCFIQGHTFRALTQSEFEIDIVLLICVIVMRGGLLIHRGWSPRPQWMPTTADSTEPWRYYVVSWTSKTMIKFNL